MSEFDYEARKYQNEVSREAARLVREGVPPYDATEQATRIVSARRRQAAGLGHDFSDVKESSR